ncbi:MAG: DegQ family serine endoprotease [Rhodospirillales bacterium]|nr:MAG: DegQ family serine endoprotease [Rhodospirillales bacterium]
MTNIAVRASRLPSLRGSAAALAFGLILVWSGLAQAAPAPDGFSSLAKKSSPSVVWITTTRDQTTADKWPELPFKFPDNVPFGEFFRKFEEHGGQRIQPQPMQGLGSGFVVDPAGYIVTSDHVIDGADAVRVRLNDDREYEAKVVGTDPLTDIAVLKIEAEKPLPAVAFGDSDAAEVGDWVMAVGNPFGLGGTVTTGIISARGRNINAGPYDDFLQVDAPINKGNSGGPLFDMNGRVIGVNTAIVSPNGGSVGIGFAVPSNLVEPVVAQIRENGRVTRGWLGVQVQQLTDEIASAIGSEGTDGALVSEVLPDSPAAEAGLRQGDVIRKVDGKVVGGPRDLARLIARHPAETTVALDLWRDGAKQMVKVVAGEMPNRQQLAAAGSEGQSKHAGRSDALAANLAVMTPELRTELQLAENVDGVVITGIDSGPAFEQGLRKGDVIREIAHQPVTNPAEVDRLVREAASGKKKAVLLLVSRRGQNLFIGLTPAIA